MRFDSKSWWSARSPVLALVALGIVAPAAAQNGDPAVQCQSVSNEVEERCLSVLQALEIAQPRLGLAFSGGNPVPGTGSTMGMRLGALPRVSIGGRITAVWTEIPDVLDDPEEELSFPVPSVDLDVSVGLFSGFSPAPTVGGVGSVDLLASAGIIPIPEGEGFVGDKPMSWAVGARVGILRESFVVPGISISGMYRRMDEVAYGDSTLTDEPAFFSTDLTNLSVRATIGKRLLFLGATAGVGYDKYTSEMVARARAPGTPFTATVEFEDFENSRTSAFVNLSWTMLILHLVGEVGWQSGGDAVEGARIGTDFDPEKGTYFGSFAIRLSI